MDHNRCRACDQDFGSVDAFDEHRKGYRIGAVGPPKGKCLSGSALGFLSREATDGSVSWWTPESVIRRDAFVARKVRRYK